MVKKLQLTYGIDNYLELSVDTEESCELRIEYNINDFRGKGDICFASIEKDYVLRDIDDYKKRKRGYVQIDSEDSAEYYLRISNVFGNPNKVLLEGEFGNYVDASIKFKVEITPKQLDEFKELIEAMVI